MTRNELHRRACYHAEKAWESLIVIRPQLVRFDMPKIEFNPRMWVTGGWCRQESRIVELSLKFTIFSQKHGKYMQDVILPHELIHQADFDLYGESDKSCGHGTQWQKLMVEYGLPAEKYLPWELKIQKNFSIKGII